MLALRPDSLRSLRGRSKRTVCVSATNGKTTLTAMLAAVCEQAGASIVHNMAGANLRSGIATALVAAPRGADVALLETDEAALPTVVDDLAPDVLVLANLFRDQLDRYGELETLAARWSAMLARIDPQHTVVVYNADDPLIAATVQQYKVDTHTRGLEPRLLAFGCEDQAVGQQRLPDTADSKFCRVCSTLLTYEHSFIGHLGHWRCTGCGAARPQPDVFASGIALNALAGSDLALTADGASFQVSLQIPGLYNVYNALAAAAAATALQMPDPKIQQGLNDFAPAFGRFERIRTPDGTMLTLLLVKNPVGLSEVARTLARADVDLGAILFALNDGIADGRDTSWIWDADIEPLLDRLSSLVVTGERAAEFAVRARYGGLDTTQIIVEEDLEHALDLLLQRAQDVEGRQAFALLTYTAMMRFRALIRRRGWVSAYWERDRDAA